MDAVVLDDALTSPDPSGPGESRFAPPDGARAFRLPGGVLLLDIAAGIGIPGVPGDVLLDGAPLPPPSCTLLLGPAGAMRRLTAAPHPWTEGRRGHPSFALLRRGVPATAPFDAAWGNAPDFLRAARGLPGNERACLLRFLAGTCAPILRVAAHPGFASLLHAIARGLVPATEPGARPLTRAAESLMSLWTVPAGAPEGTWHLLTPRRIARIAAPVAGTVLLDGAADLGGALLLPPAGAEGRLRRPMPLAAPRRPLPMLLAPTDAGGAPDAVSAALARHAAAGDDRAARLLRHRRLLAPALPVRGLDDPARPLGGALELALSDGAGGVFVSGWLRDPFGLAKGGLALRDPRTGATVPIPAGRLHRLPRPDLSERLARAPHGSGPLPGFVAHLPKAEDRTGGPVPQWHLDLGLASGEAIELTAPPGALPARRARDLVLRAVHPAALRPTVLDDCLTPAVARLQAAALAALAPPEVVQVGAPGPARVAVIVPLYRNLSFLRFQVAAFARDPDFRATARLILVLDSPEQSAEVEHLLRGLHAIHGLPATFVVMAENAGYAPACNAGAAVAPEAAHLLLLNSDVVPEGPGWLAALRRPLERDPHVLATGPKLLFDDGSVQHAGLFFLRHGPEGDWLNGHYAKGLPRQHPAANRAGPVPGVTGAALLVRRSAFDAVGGLCTDYVVGDYEDSDLCLGLRALGGDIRYVPSAELYHFERQSIVGHAGYARTLACAHNRRLHHRRWDAEIDSLMRAFPATGPRARRGA